MLCDNCKKNQATVHMTQSINNESVETHLCQECASQFEMPISFDNLLQGFLDSFFQYMPDSGVSHPMQEAVTCPDCGMSYNDFKSTSRLGCAKCYETFDSEFKSIFKNIQGASIHQGKFPKKSGAKLMHRRNLEIMKQKLREAVEKEEFETAAELRDQIRNHERSGENG